MILTLSCCCLVGYETHTASLGGRFPGCGSVPEILESQSLLIHWPAGQNVNPASGRDLDFFLTWVSLNPNTWQCQ